MYNQFKHYDPKQSLILSPNLDDWLPKNHLARFISKVVDDLDLNEIYTYYKDETRGAPPFDPKMMVKIRLYADAVGKPSSRVIYKSMVEDVGFRFLGAGNFPDHRTISDFKKNHREVLEGIFQQVLQLCKNANLTKMGRIALDGTKIKGNASKNKNYKMNTLEKKEDKLLEEIAKRLIQKSFEIDEEEDRIYGPDNDGWSLPKDALERVRKAKKQLEEKEKKEQKEYEEILKKRSEKKKGIGKKIRGRKPIAPEDKKRITSTGKPKIPTANTTDPDTRLMKTRNGYLQGYNAQIVIDVESQIILATELTQDCNDKKQLESMLLQTIDNTEKIPGSFLADAGYDNQKQIDKFPEIEMYIPTQKDYKQRKAMREQSAPKGRIPNSMTKRERRERKLITKKGKEEYKKRGIVEAVNGQIKSIRGLFQVLTRGRENANSEWKMYCTGHNLLKLWKHSLKMNG